MWSPLGKRIPFPIIGTWNLRFKPYQQICGAQILTQRLLCLLKFLLTVDMLGDLGRVLQVVGTMRASAGA